MISLLVAFRKAYLLPERSRQPLPDVEKLEKLAASKILPNSTTSDFSRSTPPVIGCGGFRRIFCQSYWSPTSFLCRRLQGAAKL
jgi:hypothetical protein